MLLSLASSFNLRAVDTVWGLQTKVKPKEPHFNILPQKLNAVDMGLSDACERLYVLRKVIVYRSLCLFFLIFYLFIYSREIQRERQRHSQREKQAGSMQGV